MFVVRLVGLPAPTNVQVRRVSSTAIEVSWDAVAYHGVIGYRVYYHRTVLPDMDDWSNVDIGPYSVTEVSGLESRTVYAVRVRARGADGRLGNFSDIAFTNQLENGELIILAT